MKFVLTFPGLRRLRSHRTILGMSERGRNHNDRRDDAARFYRCAHHRNRRAAMFPRALPNGINFTRTFTAPIKLSSNSVLRGIVLNRHKEARRENATTRMLAAFASKICYIGTDVTGTIARPNLQGGIVVGGNLHRIGGTIPGRGNVISGNNGHGINLPGAFPTSALLVANNFIGTDRTGTADLGNTGDGIFAVGGSMTVGGTLTADTRNVISGNSGNGINVLNTGVIIQNNRIGTSADGNTDLGNDKTGLRIVGGFGATIGGTAAGTRNIISGNGRDGIELNFGDTHKIEGNHIGTKADGTTRLINDRHAIFLTNFTARTIIGGDTVTPGTCDGPCNVLGFGANGSAISITNENPPNLMSNPAGDDLENSANASAAFDSPNGNSNQHRAYRGSTR